MENTQHGPLLTDREFFTLLDGRIDGLRPAIRAAESGDIDSAVHLFAEFVRRELPVEKYFSMSTPPQLTDNLLAQAERALDHEMSSCGTRHKFDGPVDWFANPTYNGYKEWTWQLSRHSEIRTLANAYRLTEDEKYAVGAAELLDSWMDQAKRPEDGAGRGDTLCWRTIECGIRMLGCWPTIIHSLIGSKAFTDRLITDLFKSVYEHGHRLITCLSHGNWLIMELSGLINICVVYPYFKECDGWRETALNRFLDEMLSQIHPDGFQYELTTNYHDVVMVNMRVVMLLTETYGYGTKERLYETMHRMLHVYVKLMQSGGLTPDINDGSKRPASFFINKYISFFPDDEVLKFIVTDGKEGTPPDYTSSILKNAGHVTLRESWDPNAVTAFFDGGKLGKAHSHEDKLNLLIYADGQPVISELGNFAYDSSDMRKHALSSFAHNVATVNGKGQSRRPAYQWDDGMLTSEEPVEYSFSEDMDRVSAVYDEGFGGEDMGNASHRRTVLFIKKPTRGRPYFIVVDDVTAEQENERAFLWHLQTEGFSLGKDRVDFKEARILLAADIDYLGMDMGATEPFRGWSTRTGAQLDQYPIPTLRATVRGKCTRTVTLIAPKKEGVTPVTSLAYADSTVTVTYDDGQSESFEI